MKINTAAEYNAALDHANRLRGKGAAAHDDPELAVLDAAIYAYEATREPTKTTPGRPTRASSGRELPDVGRKG